MRTTARTGKFLLALVVTVGLAGAAFAAEEITPEQARTIALDRAGGGTVVETDTDRKRHGLMYEFEIIGDGVKSEVEVDSHGTVRKFKQKRHRKYSSAAPRAAVLAPALSIDDAQDRAREHFAGGQVIEYELDSEDGRLVHEMTLVKDGRHYEITVDDASGEIVELSRD